MANGNMKVPLSGKQLIVARANGGKKFGPPG